MQYLCGREDSPAAPAHKYLSLKRLEDRGKPVETFGTSSRSKGDHTLGNGVLANGVDS